MIYRFRVILDNDTEDDVFRDLEIQESDSLEDLHNIITQSFGFDGLQMASFYISDEEWNQGEEISMFDVSEGLSEIRIMNQTKISNVVHEVATKLIYVYDFMSMWTFFVELAEIIEETPGSNYPNLMFAHGNMPEEAPEKNFEAEKSDFDNEDDLDIDDYDNLDFDENWN